MSVKSEHFQGGVSGSAVTRCGGGAAGAGGSCSSCELWGQQSVQRLLQTTKLPSVPSLPTVSLVHSLTKLLFSTNVSTCGFCQPLILTNELFVWPNCRTDPNTNHWVKIYWLKIIFSTSLRNECKEWGAILSQDTHQNLGCRLSWSAP